MPPTLAHWQEWRARCALQRCGPEATAALRGFAWLRFQRCAGAVLGEDCRVWHFSHISAGARIETTETLNQTLEDYFINLIRPGSA